MKKKLLLSVIIVLTWGISTSQTLTRAPFKVKSTSEKVAQLVTANYFSLGYCSDAIPTSGLGSSQAVTATLLIKLPASILSSYVGDSICALNVGLCGTANNVVAVIRESATGADLATKTFNGVAGWNQVKFDKGVTIANKDYYVGYTITLAAKQYYIGTSETTLTANALFIDGTDCTTDYGALSVKALLLGNESHFSNLAEISNIALGSNYAQNSQVNIPVTIKNNGINNITSVEVSYKYGDKQLVSVPFTGLNFGNNQTATVTIPQVSLDVSGKIDFTITKINNATTSTPAVSKQVTVYDPANAVPRKSLMEEFTTEKCGYCPAGALRIESALSNNNYKDKIIWVCHHVGYYTDSYTISASNSYLRFYGGSSFAPAMMIDRTAFDDLSMNSIPVAGVGTVSDIGSFMKDALDVPSFITVNISQNNATITSDSKVSVTVSGEYKGTLPTEDLYAFVYLTEDGLKSTTQADYSGTYSGTYTHNNVIRTSLNGTGGQKITWNGNNYSLTFTGTLNSAWLKENMNVTAFVAKNYTNAVNNVNVLNAAREKLSLTGNGIDHTYANSITAYCKNGKIEITGEYTSIEVYNINGKEVNNNNLQKGVYIVKITDVDKLATKKVVVY